MEPTTTQGIAAAPRSNGNGRKGILHEASATEHAAVPAAELDGLGFDPEESAAELEDASAEEALGWALEHLPSADVHRLLVPEDELGDGPHGAAASTPDARFFYLDTDVLFPETYETKDRLEERYGINFHRYSSITLEQQKGLYGDELWSRDPDACCGIRKVEPMRSALAAVDLWVSGIRRSDSQTRARAPEVRLGQALRALEAQPARRLVGGAGLGLHPRARHPLQPAARSGLSLDRLHPLHPEARRPARTPARAAGPASRRPSAGCTAKRRPGFATPSPLLDHHDPLSPRPLNP